MVRYANDSKFDGQMRQRRRRSEFRSLEQFSPWNFEDYTCQELLIAIRLCSMFRFFLYFKIKSPIIQIGLDNWNSITYIHPQQTTLWPTWATLNSVWLTFQIAGCRRMCKYQHYEKRANKYSIMEQASASGLNHCKTFREPGTKCLQALTMHKTWKRTRSQKFAVTNPINWACSHKAFDDPTPIQKLPSFAYTVCTRQTWLSFILMVTCKLNDSL